MNKKTKKAQDTSIRKERENNIIYPTDNEKIRDYYKQLYVTISQLELNVKFLEKQKLLKLTQEDWPYIYKRN